MCFVIYGQEGSGKDFTLNGGVVSHTGEISEPDMKAKWREPGLVRLVFETVLGNIVAVSFSLLITNSCFIES